MNHGRTPSRSSPGGTFRLVLATVGDLIDDVVVRLSGPINIATDTPSRITRRRGGSAANVASTAGVLGAVARFLGQVGDDPVGTGLTTSLAADGVDTKFVRRRGSTGTIIVLVDADGERSMLTDRRTCAELDDPRPEWLADVTTLHVPLYSLIGGAMATTAATLVEWAHDRSIAVSIDLSSTSLMEAAGLDRVTELIAATRPDVVFANSDEAAVLGLDDRDTRLAGQAPILVVKHGGEPAIVHASDGTTTAVPALAIDDVGDTTAAGDAFAGGFLTSPDWHRDPVGACVRGHAAAHRILTGDRS